MDESDTIAAKVCIATWLKHTARIAVEALCAHSEKSFYVLVVVPVEECIAPLKTLIDVDLCAVAWEPKRVEHTHRLTFTVLSFNPAEAVAKRGVARLFEQIQDSFTVPRPGLCTGDWVLVSSKGEVPRGLYFFAVAPTELVPQTIPVIVLSSRTE